MSLPQLFLSPWIEMPGHANGAFYVLGDVHGNHDLLQSALSTMDKSLPLISLGDVIDTGPAPLACLNTLKTSGFASLTLLAGNHEIMAAQALTTPDTHFAMWEMAGGHTMLEETGLKGCSLEQCVDTLTGLIGQDTLTNILQGPSHYQSGDCLMVHAGISPHINKTQFLAQPAIASVPMHCHWAWIRDPFLTWTKGWETDKKTLIFHGHTPAIRRPFEGWDDLHALYQARHFRVNLDLASEGRPQIAWAHVKDGYMKLGVACAAGGDIF